MDQVWRGSQVTDSAEHPGWRRGLRAGQDIGGNFYTQKRHLETEVSQGFAMWTRSGFDQDTDQKYWGPILAAGPNIITSMPPANASSSSLLDSLGATAVARCKPTNALADVSNFLGELAKDGLPKMIGLAHKEGTRRAQKAGSEYLNVEFGWKPIVRDLQDFVTAVVQADDYLSQLERDAGRVVRRRYSFPPESTKTSNIIRSNHEPFMTVGATWTKTGMVPAGRLIHDRESYRRRWFSGAFTYPMPKGLKSRIALARYAQRARDVYGLELTPSTVWNLAPWSWAVDWFSNTGDVISNLTDWATDGLVMRYGYIMEHSFVRDTYTYTGSTNYQRSSYPQPLSFVTETKQRRQANPFGFGLTWGGLTPRQVAILTAIGITSRK